MHHRKSVSGMTQNDPIIHNNYGKGFIKLGAKFLNTPSPCAIIRATTLSAPSVHVTEPTTAPITISVFTFGVNQLYISTSLSVEFA